jgi:hypothetical protein
MQAKSTATTTSVPAEMRNPPPTAAAVNPDAGIPDSAQPVSAESPAPPQDSPEHFRTELAPYGEWVQGDQGQVWKPNVSAGWRPYYDGGHWTYTDSGWYWQSDYPWGDIAFHYGRWYFSLNAHGWVWVPGNDFAPAWVSWRHTDGYLGWAPLPPAARFEAGVGLTFNGALAVDVDFGLAPDYYVFIDYDHFWEHDYRRFWLPRERWHEFYRRGVIMNGYRMEHGRFMVDGLGRERMGRLTHHEVAVAEMHNVRRMEAEHHAEQRKADIATVQKGGRVEAVHGGRPVEVVKSEPPSRTTGPSSTERSSGGLSSGPGGSRPTNGSSQSTPGSGSTSKSSGSNASKPSSKSKKDK